MSAFSGCDPGRNFSQKQNGSSMIEYNQKVTLTGKYVRSVMSRKDQAEHAGHYKIIVNNMLEVNLLPPYLEDAVRPKEEVKKFEGKTVAVTGIILQHTALSKPSLEYQPQTVDVPCFITIESIHLATA